MFCRPRRSVEGVELALVEERVAFVGVEDGGLSLAWLIRDREGVQVQRQLAFDALHVLAEHLHVVVAGAQQRLAVLVCEHPVHALP